MRFEIHDKQKKEMFIAIFQIMKSSTNVVSIMLNEDSMYIQGMDKSHVCLFDIKIDQDWFSMYEKKGTDVGTISVDTTTFHMIISSCKDEHKLAVYYDGNPDSLNIDLITKEGSKGEYTNFFKIPLTDYECEILVIPDTEYDAEFTISSKKMHEITSKMILFGDVIQILCNEEKIDFTANGVSGEMTVNIPMADLSEFSISEGEEFSIFYSLNYLHKMCLTNKLSTNVEISVSNEYPMKIKYDLGDNSNVLFFLAPKIDND